MRTTGLALPTLKFLIVFMSLKILVESNAIIAY